MNDAEKALVEKRKRLENEYLMDMVLSNDDDHVDESSQANDLEQRNREFILDNFFKVYDRQANAKDMSIVSPKRRQSILNSPLRKKPELRRPNTYIQQNKTVSQLSQQYQGDSDESEDEIFSKRLRLREAQEIQEYMISLLSEEQPTIQYSLIDSYLKRLSFFAKYPPEIRKKLLDQSELRVFDNGDRIFNQGDSSPNFFVNLRGSTKAILIKKDYGNIPIVVQTFYDGKEFGEVTQYQVSENLD